MTEKGKSAADIGYTLVLAEDRCMLYCGDELMWSSALDERFEAEFEGEAIDITDEEQIDDYLGWLVDNGYIPQGVDVDIKAEEDAPIDAQDV